VPERGTVTLAIRPDVTPRQAAPPAAAPPEPAQPVFTRYWLHGKGPAPAGNMPVAVHVSPARLALRPGADARIRVTVACGPAPAAGTVLLDVPAAVTLVSATWAGPVAIVDANRQDAEPGKLAFGLAGGGYAAWDVLLRVPAAAGPARHFIAARLIDDAGQLLEDVAVIAVGEPELPGAHVALEQLLPELERISQADAAEAVLRMVTGHLELPPGGSGEVTASLSNATASEIRGEAQLISPHGSWSAHRTWQAGFAAEPGQQTELSFGVTIPRDARPGQRWWALVKVMYFGRLRYSEPIWITVTPDPASR
jgi:hypothetical protein